MTMVFRLWMIGTLLVAASTMAEGQGPVAMLTHADGVVLVDDRPTTSDGVILGESAVVRTAAGRAVVALKGGGRLALDEHSSVRVLANRGYNFNRIEVLHGSALVFSETSAPLVSCASDARLSSSGIFRFDVHTVRGDSPATCRFRVYDGAAAVPLTSVISALRSWQSMMLDPSCGDMIPVLSFSPDQLDDFDRWSRRLGG
jgi:ferric-dicitrate binding protein FerR (iron transport regulator)